jgi:hypothetical protein
MIIANFDDIFKRYDLRNSNEKFYWKLFNIYKKKPKISIQLKNHNMQKILERNNDKELSCSSSLPNITFHNGSCK